MPAKKIKLLLVDDEESFVNTLAERLRLREFNPQVALSGEDGLAMIAKSVPDVMVLDLRMPGIDGMEVLRQVRKANPKVQVIILTGHGTEKDKEEATRIGCFEYMKKPVDIDALIFSITNAYQKKLEGMMVAAAFAEAGDFDSADESMIDDGLKDRTGK
ncbi:response regulator [Megalodesulfovibrio gigas]|uniref:Putative response regulator n=1 Tax=Megalodesulfovibrio gigas (strain ATCC 19364 / DSM 1382 / NCIMB 9332 / VKM B-1759) TaxID=1121448 RepID=T2G8E0_MEGG1|nr:response regulator [Megalodesulfovibrio gigas]AGW12449.1 putative response regulator [Megalodesulfovibrio gigas DSM 1382 = ATCC 19364]